MVFAAIGVFYYLRVVKLMYFDAPVDEEPIVADFDNRAILSTASLATLALGILPGGLLAWCATAFV